MEIASSTSNKLVLAAALSPLLLIPFVFLWSSVVDDKNVLNAIGGGLMYALVAYPILVIYGLPIHFLYEKRQVFRLWPYVLAGFAGPFLVLVPFTLSSGGIETPIFFGICGAIVSTSFWQLAVSK